MIKLNILTDDRVIEDKLFLFFFVHYFLAFCVILKLLTKNKHFKNQQNFMCSDREINVFVEQSGDTEYER